MADWFEEDIEESVDQAPGSPGLNEEQIRFLSENNGTMFGDFQKAASPRLEYNLEKHNDKSLYKNLKPGESYPHYYKDEDVLKRLSPEVRKSLGEGVTTGLEGRSKGWSGVGKIKEALGSETAKNIFTVLGADEHAIVKSLSKITGDEYENFGDYTWSNFIKARGMPDDWRTEVLGLGMSIFLSPSTYLTFGTGGLYKAAGVGVKTGGVALTKRGMKFRNAIVKKHTDRLTDIGNARMAKEGRKLSSIEINKINEAVAKKTDRLIIKEFGDLYKKNETIRAAKSLVDDVKTLKDGKIRLNGTIKNKAFSIVPDDRHIARAGDIRIAGKTVISGERMLKITSDSGLPKLADALRKTKAGQITGKTTGAVANWLEEVFTEYPGLDKNLIRSLEEAPDLADKIMSSPGVKQMDKDLQEGHKLIAYFNVAKKKAEEIKDFNMKTSERFFKGLNKEELADFAESAIKASVKGKDIKRVKSLKGLNNVQHKLDEWYGQAGFSGKSVADELWEQSQRFGLDPEKIPNWFPGIIEKLSYKSMRLDAQIGPDLYGFLRPRIGDPDAYTRNPIKAYATRLTQIGFSDIQSELYNKIVKLKLGNLKEFKNSTEASEAGYVALQKPKTYKLLTRTGDPEAILKYDEIMRYAKEKTYYVKKEFGKRYEKLYGSPKYTGYNPLDAGIWALAYPTNIFKSSVTRIFPAFHVRNFESNLILNSLRIGMSAFNRRVNSDAFVAAIDPENISKQVNLSVVKTEAGKKAKTRFSAILDGLRGKLKNEYVSETGERFTIGELVKEANLNKAINVDDYMVDPFGDGLSPLAKSKWTGVLWRTLNPFSNDSYWQLAGRNIGNMIETQARLTNYTHWRMKGLSPRLAAFEANEALYNYQRVNQFENIANVFIPFYTWMARNTTNHAKLLGTAPGAVIAQQKIYQSFLPSEKDLRENYPDYIKKRLMFRFGENMAIGWGMPFEDVMALATMEERDAITKINPYIRYGLEKFIAKKDFYTQRPLENLKTANEFRWLYNMARYKLKSDDPILNSFLSVVQAPFRGASNFLDLKLDKKYNKVIGNPDLLHLIRSMPTARAGSVMATFGKEMSKDEHAGMRAALRFMTGIAFVAPDPKLKKSISFNKMMKQMEVLAIKGDHANKIIRTKNGPLAFHPNKMIKNVTNYIIRGFDPNWSVERQRRHFEKVKIKFEKAEEKRIQRSYR